jgi:hypothetical protein
MNTEDIIKGLTALHDGFLRGNDLKSAQECLMKIAELQQQNEEAQKKQSDVLLG